MVDCMMKKNKQWLVFTVLFIGLILIVGFRYFKTTGDIYVKRNARDNPAVKIIMTGGNDYIAGQGEFHTGFFDIEAVKPVHTNSFKLGANQKILNKAYRNGNEIHVEEGDTIMLTPSQFKPLQFRNKIAVLENTIGQFHCGTEIEAGTYEFTIEVEKDNMEFFFQVESEDKRQIKDSAQINHMQRAKLIIEEGDYLSIRGIDYDTGDFKVKIRKLV